MITLIIATRNQHKVDEIQAILGPEFRFMTLRDFPDAPEVEEDAPTFAGNASKKSRELALWLAKHNKGLSPGKCFVLADDSGLEVDALGGAPGVHSARFSSIDTGRRGNSSSADNNAKLLRLLAGVPSRKRTGRFHCVVALSTVPPSPQGAHLFNGTCEGHIQAELKGSGGFGYDPLFVPDGFRLTFAELGEEVKNGLSHRARALSELKNWLATQ